jgi:hypothetical protein
VAGELGWVRKVLRRAHPPGPREMLGYVRYPKRHERGHHIFPQVPRKLDSAIPSRAGEVGWGLWYAERTRYDLLYVPIAVPWSAFTVVLFRALLDSRRGVAWESVGGLDEVHGVSSSSTRETFASWVLPLMFAFYVCGNVFVVFRIVGVFVEGEAEGLVLPEFTYSSTS